MAELDIDVLKKKIKNGEIDQEAVARMRKTFPGLDRELKEEWKECAKFCEQKRKENWRPTGAHGVSKGGTMQQWMKLPRLAIYILDREFGTGEWLGNEKAMNWAWKAWPQFRLVERK